MIERTCSATLPRRCPSPRARGRAGQALDNLRFTDRLPDELPADPMHFADAWLKEAMANAGVRNPNSMMLATAGANGQPSARVVLCKLFVPDPGYVVFYTNYHSRKGRQLVENPKVAAAFYWDDLGLQIRLEGLAVRSPTEESDAYFATRDRGSQIGAWGSDQSTAIVSREALVAQVRERAAQMGISWHDGAEALADIAPPVARPPHWGGIRMWASAIELWVEGKNRIHDRALWKRHLAQTDEYTFSVSPWSGERLQP
jgi:pyridoxamine 5'-phosphate oxidase